MKLKKLLQQQKIGREEKDAATAYAGVIESILDALERAKNNTEVCIKKLALPNQNPFLQGKIRKLKRIKSQINYWTDRGNRFCDLLFEE